MPFKKGQGGRPKGAPNKRTTLEEVLREIDPTEGRVYWQQLHAIAAGKHDDVHARLKALGLILSYREGKPIERTEISGKDGQPVPISIVHKHVTVTA